VSVLPVCAIIIVDSTVIFGYLALLPKWVQQYSDESFALGFVVTAANVTIMAGMLVLGALADRVGVRSTLRLSLLGMIASLVAHAFASTYRGLVLARCAMSFFAATMTLCKTYVLVAVPEADRDNAIRATSICQVISISIGSAAGLIASVAGLTCAQINLFMALLCACAFAISQTGLKDVVAEKSAGAKAAASRAEHLVAGAMGYVTFAAQAMLATILVAGATDALKRFGSETLYQVSFCLFSAFGIVGGWCGPPFKACLGSHLACALCLLCYASAAVVFEQAASPAGFCAGFALAGFADGLRAAVVQLVLNAHVGKDRLGAANGAIDASGALARILVPLVVARLYNDGLAWRAGLLLPVSALPLLLAVPPERREWHPMEAELSFVREESAAAAA